MDAREWIKEANECPLDRALFSELFVFAQESLSGARRTIPPHAERCLEDLPEGTLVLTDVPMNQMGLGLVDECHRRFPNDSDRAEAVFKSFMWRYWAVLTAVKDGRARQFVRTVSGRSEIHSAILFAAAECELKPQTADFAEPFFDRAKQIYGE